MTVCSSRRGWMSVVSGIVLAAGAVGSASAQSLNDLPKELQALYTGTNPVGPSAYDDFKMPAKPWKWCHSESTWAIPGG